MNWWRMPRGEHECTKCSSAHDSTRCAVTAAMRRTWTQACCPCIPSTSPFSTFGSNQKARRKRCCADGSRLVLLIRRVRVLMMQYNRTKKEHKYRFALADTGQRTGAPPSPSRCLPLRHCCSRPPSGHRALRQQHCLERAPVWSCYRLRALRRRRPIKEWLQHYGGGRCGSHLSRPPPPPSTRPSASPLSSFSCSVLLRA